MMLLNELGKTLPQAVGKPASNPTPEGAIGVGTNLLNNLGAKIDPWELLGLRVAKASAASAGVVKRTE